LWRETKFLCLLLQNLRDDDDDYGDFHLQFSAIIPHHTIHILFSEASEWQTQEVKEWEKEREREREMLVDVVFVFFFSFFVSGASSGMWNAVWAPLRKLPH
jgi:hypothetical protein